MSSLEPLRLLHERIAEIGETPVGVYRVPARWINSSNPPYAVEINPYQHWHNVIGQILTRPATPLSHAQTTGGDWTRYAHVYNLFVRSALAYDHDGDGKLGRPNADGLNEAGSFTKAICLLPYIRALGCNTVHLLPITAIGQDGNKGDAGSPYAIRNQYKLDNNLAEPSLGLGVEAEFAAFVAAAHHLGIRVVVEFVFRTASKDADMVGEHPDWFYWIDAAIADRRPGSDDENSYGMPVFSADELAEIVAAVEAKAFDKLRPPHAVYRNMFLPAPRTQDVRMIDGRWIANYPDGRHGRIPGAFSDWPPFEMQPPWGDVTYLRLYNHPDFNYIAYNTLRMYDTRLAQAQNRVGPLWTYLVNIIPHYQHSYGIDGAMIDMGHALPTALKQAIVNAARSNDRNFAFWDENFVVSQQSVDEGYNAVMGNLAFIMYQPDKLRWALATQIDADQPLPCFGAIENHNTPRAAARPGGVRYARYAFAIAAFLPTLPFVHNGLELGETLPINTGTDFTPEALARYPSDQLPLFSAVPFRWTDGGGDLFDWIRQTLALRERFIDLITDPGADTIGQLTSDNPHISGVLRHTADWSAKIALIFNSDMHAAHEVWMPLPTGRSELMDHYTGRYMPVSNAWIHARLGPGEVVWYEL